MARSNDTVPAEPFVAWLNSRRDLLRAGDQAGVMVRLAAQTGISERWLRNYLQGLDTEGKPAVAFERRAVEDALDRAGAAMWELYPSEIDDAAAVERYCRNCKDTVTVAEDGLCPWCERETEPLGGRRKRFCSRCDRMLYPARDGSCWRCGGSMSAHAPWDECGCGCGGLLARFDAQGRRRSWLRGHAPKPYLEERIDVEPFAVYLERQLAELDPIDALARMHACPREVILHALGRRGPLERETITRALWAAGRQGKGIPRKPGVPTFSDLYPEKVRQVTCPDCNGRKAAGAERCKRCAVAHRRRQQQDLRRGAQVREELIQEAWRLHDQEGLAVLDIARRLLDQTPYASAPSLQQALLTQFKRRGLEVQNGIPVPDEIVDIAWRLHERAELPVGQIAERLLGRTKHPTASSLRTALYRQFKARGLKVHKGARGLPRAVVDQAWRLHTEQGLTIAQAARELDVSDSRLRAALTRRGLRPRRGPARRALQLGLSAEQIAELHAEHLDGWSVRQIAERHSLDADALRDAFRMAGLELRRGSRRKTAALAAA